MFSWVAAGWAAQMFRSEGRKGKLVKVYRN
jgi:hypothetical protein